MNTLRLCAVFFLTLLSYQAALAQDEQGSETKVVCAVLVDGSDWCPGDPWPPQCDGAFVWGPTGCEPVWAEAYRMQYSEIDTTDLTYHWPIWWPKPWNIPRPPYPWPWEFGPLPDPWVQQQIVIQQQQLAWQQQLAMQQNLGIGLPTQMGATGANRQQPGMPVLIGTDEGTAVIPDFCLVAEWVEGKIPPECEPLSGLVRKLGLSPDAAPLLNAAPD